MCIITFLRRRRIPKILKKQSSENVTVLNDQWKSSSFQNRISETGKESENLKKNKTSFKSSDLC